MAKIKIYRFAMYSINDDCYRTSKRWGTREGIDFINGLVLEGTDVEVDEDVVGREIKGLTDRDFNPNRLRSGFPNQVA